MLVGREREQAVIDALLAEARAGRSGALVVRGEAGIGKTALLDYAAAQGFPVARSAGIESEAELPFAALHLLVRPGMELVRALPDRQRAALEGAFGLAEPGPGDRMLIGLAVLSLLAEEAAHGPLLCLIDDAHWLDEASASALLFAARRLGSEGVAMIFATRSGPDDFPAPGLAELPVTGLAPDAAATLLDRAGANLSPATRYRLLTESAGNPLALLELPAAVASSTIDASDPLPLTQRLRVAFHGRVARLPAPTRTLLLVAATATGSALAPILRAAGLLGAGPADLQPAEDAGLVDTDGRTLTLRHPLVRTAILQGAPVAQRLAAHRALAEALADEDSADLRAWHAAAAATGPDAATAAALERTAERARARSGFQGAVRAYERAAALSPAPMDRARRLVLASETASAGGMTDQAVRLGTRALHAVPSAAGASAAGAGAAAPRDGGSAHRGDRASGTATADHGPSAAELALRVDLVHAAAEFAAGAPGAAHRRYLAAAAEVAATEPGVAARILSRAVHAAWYLGPAEIDEVTGLLATLTLDADDPVTPVVAYLAGALNPFGGAPARLRVRDGADPDPAAGGAGRVTVRTADAWAGDLTAAAAAARRNGATDPADLVQLCGSGLVLGHDDQVAELAGELVARCREEGRIGVLPPLLFFRAEAHLFGGRPGESRVDAEEGARIAADTGQGQWISQLAAFLAYQHALRGDAEACVAQADRARAEEFGGDAAAGSSWAGAALGLLALGAGDLATAWSHLDLLNREPARHHVVGLRTLADQIEVAARLGHTAAAADALGRLRAWADGSGRPWVRALAARGAALLVDDEAAESSFREALDTTGHPFDEARTRLLLGEWLRRARRKTEARAELTRARDTFDRLGAAHWSRRASGELAALGAGAPSAGPGGAAHGLTPQETQIVRLAAQGLSNREIAERLFLSHRTVGHHLYKAYPKLGVASRAELAGLDPATFPGVPGRAGG
ncbi:AAA family ATPase [Nocardia thailandica]|uniref:AAA family ATPase n=1 Tax=Nocardia thailandica TaxID=257275 RepID=A0ABW6PJ00_9NOCA